MLTQPPGARSYGAPSSGRFPAGEGVGGRYFENRGESLSHNPQSADSTEPSGVAAHALDEQDAARLGEVSLAMLEA
ncbi:MULTISPECIES: hypothetical protein [unclassified Streptomyces]|uniref:hypothetical protein n=1 Tax=unclassified Streptomyces TaxID=2593676 RepID=UPI00114CDAD4|nr:MULTISPECIES: hypothetical protein [unclassified Streptomyces]MYZ36091.1 hypothetical protein [Streptomyces sp. SID4917]